MNLILQNHEIFPISGRKQLVVDLWKGSTNIYSMVYDIMLHTARLESNGTRRMFMVYAEGRRLPKTVFKNEYGFDVGVIDPSLAVGNYGCIQLYGNTFYYNLSYKNDNQLSIYRVLETQPVLSVALTYETKDVMPDDYYHFLLVGLCWYLQQPVKNPEMLNTTFTDTGKQLVTV